MVIAPNITCERVPAATSNMSVTVRPRSSVLVRETAGALASMGFDQAELVTACRRVVDRHLTVGPLWWLCARVLCSAEPRLEAWACADDVESTTI